MEGPIQPRSKPLSYDALKSVIKSMSLEKRQELHNHLPSLRPINSVLPYTIKAVRIMPNALVISRQVWSFCKNKERVNSDDAVSNKTTVSIFDSVSGRLASDINVNKSFEEVFEKCFNVFLNGSNIQDVGLYHVPKFLCETDRSDGFKLNISNLITNCVIGDKFDSFIRFVNLDNLGDIYISFDDRRNESEEQFVMLGKPNYPLQESRLARIGSCITNQLLNRSQKPNSGFR